MSYIYVLRAGNSNLYKIGKADDPSKRRDQLQTGCPFKLHEVTRLATADVLQVESNIHKALSGYRLRTHDTEWFELPSQQLATQTVLCYAMPLSYDSHDYETDLACQENKNITDKPVDRRTYDNPADPSIILAYVALFAVAILMIIAASS